MGKEKAKQMRKKRTCMDVIKFPLKASSKNILSISTVGESMALHFSHVGLGKLPNVAKRQFPHL